MDGEEQKRIDQMIVIDDVRQAARSRIDGTDIGYTDIDILEAVILARTCKWRLEIVSLSLFLSPDLAASGGVLLRRSHCDRADGRRRFLRH